jgi:hypothetical protein
MMMSIHLRSRNERLLILVSRSLEVQQDDTQLSQIASKFCKCRTGPIICSDEWAARVRITGGDCTRIQLDVSKFRGPFFGGEEGGTRHD